MATAVQPSPTTTDPKIRLAVASLFGAALILGGVFVAAYLVPIAWQSTITPVLGKSLGGPADVAFRMLVQLAAVGGFIWLGSNLAGANPPRGIRGGIGLTISLVIAIFFITRAVALNLEDVSLGMPITIAVLAGLLFGSFRLMTSELGLEWMVAIEDQGWFSTFAYKKTQGIKLRRYTLLGLLAIAWTGIATLYNHTTLGTGNWVMKIPFSDPVRTVTVLTDIEYTIPFLLALATLWLGWRVTNIPSFADFLIATEAEMNKVSWSTRKRLMQDTVVVLVTTFLLTCFLMAVDVFWGWLLSRQMVGVLPSRSATTGPAQVKGAEW